jgi:hypothetical protein
MVSVIIAVIVPAVVPKTVFPFKLRSPPAQVNQAAPA